MKEPFLYIILFCSTVSCTYSSKHSISVKQFTDSATSLTKQFTDTSKFSEAIDLFNQAILLDSNDVNSYSKKFFLQISLGEFIDAEKTLTKLILLRPDSAELYVHAGFFQEFRYDTIGSKESFRKAMLLYNATLDTMNMKNPNWVNDWKISAICTIMAGQEKLIHDFLKENCTTALDSIFYDIETLTKSKEEISQSIRTKYSR